MASIPKSLLEAGLAALKQGDYPTAIAHLETVCDNELSQKSILRAQMGLAIAYERNRHPQKAIALCQTLSQSSQTQVQDWAVKALADLTKRYPEEVAKLGKESKAEVVAETGFVPFDSKLPKSSSEPTISTSSTANTGFVPFDSKSPKPNLEPAINSSPAANTGFTPFDSKSEKTTLEPTAESAPIAESDFIPLEPTDQKSVPPDSKVENIPVTSNQEIATELQESLTQLQSSATKASATKKNVPATQPHTWKQAGRAKKWHPLKKANFRKLWLGAFGTAIALFFTLHFVLQLAMRWANDLLIQIRLRPIQLFYQNPTLGTIIFLVLLVCVSPWLFDWFLKTFYGLKPLTFNQLSVRSPEATKVLQRLCRQHNLPLPTLGILSSSAPIAMTYGNWSKTARIAVSEGLLAQLADDEIAAIYAIQLAQIRNWDFVFMSATVLFLQLPYLAYWQLAELAERFQTNTQVAKNKLLAGMFAISAFIFTAVSAISYGLYWLFRGILLWFSRHRLVYSDRFAIEATGNPNGIARALLKIALGMAEHIKQQKKTTWLLESCELLMPLGYQQAMNLGSAANYTSFESVLNWDYSNPQRNYLVLVYAHPVTGDRLQLLHRCAQSWKIEPELDLTLLPANKQNKFNFIQQLLNCTQGLPILQKAGIEALIWSIGLRGICWLMGTISQILSIGSFSWMIGDRSLFWGFLLIAFSTSIFLNINAYFPDILPTTWKLNPSLPELYQPIDSTPSKYQPVCIKGKLLGRRGISNWLERDLILDTPTGLIKLNFVSRLGFLGNLGLKIRPSNFIDRQVTVIGWLRRGTTSWIDIDILRGENGLPIQANYPLWITIMACVTTVWGAYIIWKGNY